MTSLMLEEALSATAVASRQLAVLDACLPALGQRLREVDPNLALTVARGSSDHAASYFAYLAMQHAGLPVASLPMSVVTLNRSPLRVAGQAVFAFSQSGQSPDLVDSLRILRERGALGIALVNAEDSPLEAASEFVVPLCAGTERSVAATKSFIATLSASARLLAHWQRDNALLAAGQGLAAGLEQAARLDWSPAIEALRDCQRLMVIGRGAGYAIAQEAALKFKETSAIQAEAFSSAEVRHGPMALVEERYPLLVFAPAARSRKACWRSPRICANAVRRYCSLPRTTSPNATCRCSAPRIRRSIRSWRSRASTSWPPAWPKPAAWTRTSHGT